MTSFLFTPLILTAVVGLLTLAGLVLALVWTSWNQREELEFLSKVGLEEVDDRLDALRERRHRFWRWFLIALALLYSAFVGLLILSIHSV